MLSRIGFVVGFCCVGQVLGQSITGNLCSVRWTFGGEQLRRVELEAGEELFSRDFRMEARGAWLVRSLDAGGLGAEAPHWLLALASGGGGLGNVDRVARLSGLPVDQIARWELLGVPEPKKSFTEWTPRMSWAVQLEARLEARMGVGSAPLDRADGAELLRRWRAPTSEADADRLLAVLPADCQPVLALQLRDPAGADALHSGAQAAFDHAGRVHLNAAGGSLAPAIAASGQFVREIPQAAACAWAGQFGCWRLHGLAVGRRGDRTLIAVCAQFNAERIAVYEGVGDAAIRVHPAAEFHGAWIESNTKAFRIVIGEDRSALERGWRDPCQDWCGPVPKDAAFVVRLGGAAVREHVLGGFDEVRVVGRLKGLSATLTFLNEAQGEAWIAAANRHLKWLEETWMSLHSVRAPIELSSPSKLVLPHVLYRDLVMGTLITPLPRD